MLREKVLLQEKLVFLQKLWQKKTKTKDIKKMKTAGRVTEMKELPNKDTSESSKLDEQVHEVLMGNFDIECPSESHIIRVFISSTFTDTENERNALMARVYPKLKNYCIEKGYEFQVVDMRWGVRDEATDNHQTMDLCETEIKNCQKISDGPNFVALLSEKYGYCPLIASIEEQEFDLLLSAIPVGETKDLFYKWYNKDYNAVPTSYILEPVSKLLPDFISKDDARQSEAKNIWNQNLTVMRDALAQAAKQVFDDEERKHRHEKSVTEMELENGILHPDTSPASKCLWFHRHVAGLEVNHGDAKLYYDLKNGKINKQSVGLLKRLKDSLQTALPADNIVEYQVQWPNTGPCMDDPGYLNYIDQFCLDFEKRLLSMIEKSIEQKQDSPLNDPFYQEIVQHALFAQSKLAVFYGREETLKIIEEYMKGTSRRPFVVHGPSGCGKTSILAMAAKMGQKWTKGSTILRFLGTTRSSTNIRHLLKSLINHIKKIYNDSTPLPHKLRQRIQKLPFFLSNATKSNPLLIILDSLDQLSPAGGARQLTWLPRYLPAHVKFIVSTLPDNKYRCFPKLQAMLKEEKLFALVPSLSISDVSCIMNKWLQMANRQLTQEQLQMVCDAFEKCPLPLFLRMSFDTAKSWRSFTPPDQTVLQLTIKDAINSLFDKTERQHGHVIVSHALGYLTAAVSGLTLNEIEDVLSCDDVVLDDVFQYWTPPVRRLPPLLWVRIKTDLGLYLVDREADGTLVSYWYHRQFIQTARERYLSDDKTRKMLHSALADYYLGNFELEGGENTKERPRMRSHFSRLNSVQHQSKLVLKDGKYNLRKLNELPHHLIESERFDELKDHVLCNFDWLLTKTKAFSLRSVLDDFSSALSVFEDPDIRAVEEILHLSQDGLFADSNQLASQLVARLYQVKPLNDKELKTLTLSKTLQTLLEQAQKCANCQSLIPSRAFLSPPGGQLRNTLAGHSAPISGLDITRDGQFAVTGSTDGKLKVWDVHDGSVVTNVEGIGEGLLKCRLCCDDELIVVNHKNMISFITMETGEIIHKILSPFFDNAPPFAISMSGNSEEDDCLLVFGTEQLRVHKIPPEKTPIHEFNHVKPIGNQGGETLLTVSGQVIACMDHEDNKTAKVLHLDNYDNVKDIQILTQLDVDEFLHITDLVLLKGSDQEIKLLAAKMAKIDIFSVKSGTVLQTLKGKVDDCARNISVVEDNSKLLFCKNIKVVTWDMNTEERTEIFSHPNYVTKALSHDGVHYITISADDLGRVWDLCREDVITQEPDTELAKSFESIPGAPCYIMSVNSAGFRKFTATIWDVRSCLPVRKVYNFPSSVVKIIDNKTAIVRDDLKLKLYNLDTCEIIHTFVGKLAVTEYANLDDTYVVNHGKEILTYTKARSHLKLYDIATGKLVSVLKSGRNEKLRACMTNTPGTIAICIDNLFDTILVWDVTKRELVHKLKKDDYGSNNRLLLTYARVTDDGLFFALSLRSKLKPESCRHPLIWDLSKGKFMYQLSYPNETDTVEMELLDNHSLVTCHKDNLINIWDMSKGTLLHSMKDNLSTGIKKLLVASDTRTVVTCDDKIMSLWDINRCKRKATFTTDKVLAVKVVGPNNIALGFMSIMPVVILNLKAGQENEAHYEETGYEFVGQVTFPSLVENKSDMTVDEEEDFDSDVSTDE